METVWLHINETVRVISGDTPCKDGNGRFTTVPVKALMFIYEVVDINASNFENWLFSTEVSLQNILLDFQKYTLKLLDLQNTTVITRKL